MGLGEVRHETKHKNNGKQKPGPTNDGRPNKGNSLLTALCNMTTSSTKPSLEPETHLPSPHLRPVSINLDSHGYVVSMTRLIEGVLGCRTAEDDRAILRRHHVMDFIRAVGSVLPSAAEHRSRLNVDYSMESAKLPHSRLFPESIGAITAIGFHPFPSVLIGSHRFSSVHEPEFFQAFSAKNGVPRTQHPAARHGTETAHHTALETAQENTHYYCDTPAEGD